MPRCRKPPFLSEKQAVKKRWRKLYGKRVLSLFSGQKVKVSEAIYSLLARKEYEKYLEQVDRKNHLLFFSTLDHDGHFTDNIVEEVY